MWKTRWKKGRRERQYAITSTKRSVVTISNTLFIIIRELTAIKLWSSAHGRWARILLSSWRLCSLNGTSLGSRPSLDASQRRSPPCSRNSVRCTHTRLEHFNCSAACNVRVDHTAYHTHHTHTLLFRDCCSRCRFQPYELLADTAAAAAAAMALR